METHKYNLRKFIERSYGAEVFFEIIDSLPKIGGGVFLAGGSLRRVISGITTKDSDFDFFFKSETDCIEFDKKLIESGFVIKYKNDKNTTYERDGIKVQSIYFQYFDSPQAVIDSFDFTICQLAYDGEYLYAGEYTLWDIARKRLVVNKISFATSTVRRLIKYAKQGFTACSGCISEILKAVVVNPETIQSEVEYID